MAKQDEQRPKNGQVPKHGKSVANAHAHSSATRTKAATNIEPPLSAETQTSAQPTSSSAPLLGDIRRRQFLIGGAGVAATALALGGFFWATAPHTAHQPQTAPPPSTNNGDRLVVYWNNAILQMLREQQAPLPVASRALSIMHTSMFDAWAAYDATAVGSRLSTSLRQPDDARTVANKCKAISYAAHRSLVGLFPTEQERLDGLLHRLGYDPRLNTTRASTPAGIGNLVAQAVLIFRQNDGANQQGDLQPGAYSDYTHYQSLNTPQEIKRPNYWQPLNLAAPHMAAQAQRFACAQWANVVPFALTSALAFVPNPGPPHYPDAQYTVQAQQMLQYSANLNDAQKVSAEYWSTGPDMQILARWFAFAHFISERDNHSLDQNIKLFFALANAGSDTTIACWATKRAYNSAYPLTVIRYLFKGKQVRAWGGPGKDQQWFDGQYWLPYRSPAALAPAYPEYCSEQSAVSAACAEILRKFSGNDNLGTTYTQAAHSSTIEPAVPAQPVTLSWKTLSQAANEAGMAGRYSGTHFPQSDLDGRSLGSRVAQQVWLKAQDFIHGRPAVGQ